jgi:cell division protease FtsH
MTKQTRFHLWYAFVAFFGLMAVQYAVSTAQQVATIPYSEFEGLLQQDKVEEIAVSDRFIQGSLKQALPGGQTRFLTTRIDPDFAEMLQRYHVKYAGQIESTLLRDILSWVLPIALFFGLWTFLARRMSGGLGGGLMQIGKSKAKIYVETDTQVTFEDVAGVDEAKEELREVVDFLKSPGDYGRLGGRMP